MDTTNFRSTAQRFSEAQFFMQFFRDLCSGQKFSITCFQPGWGKPVEISQRLKARATENFRPEVGCEKN
jgi:hypothetical protein